MVSSCRVGGDVPPELSAAPAKPSTLLRVCPFILGNEFCERIAYYGLSMNFVNYLHRVMGLSASDAAVQVMLFSGTCYLTPLLGAYLADAHWGRYKTILYFSALYCVGMTCMALQATLPGLRPPSGEESTWGQLLALYGALYIIAMGTGGIKPNVSAFGADQFDERDPTDARDKASFFMWFYFTVNCGSLFGTSVVVYVQESVGYSIGYMIPALALLVAVGLFVVGSPRYRHVQPAGSPFVRVYEVLMESWRNRHEQDCGPDAGSGLQQPFLSSEQQQPQQPAMHPSQSLRWLDKAALRTGSTSARRFSAKQVEEVRLVLRMMPIFLTTVLYATVYTQFSSFFILQGDYMQRQFAGVTIPAATLTIFDTIAIITLVPLYEHALLPWLTRLRRRPSMLQRIGTGMVIATLAMLAAALVERQRKAHLLENDSSLHVFWQIPQYMLIGASEVFCMVGQLEFFYDQAPDVMRSMAMAMQLLSISLGSYLSGALTQAVKHITAGPDGEGGWLPKEIDEGHLDYFFLLLAFLMLLNLGIFVIVSSRYVYKDVSHRRRGPAFVEGEYEYTPGQRASAAPAQPQATTALPISARLHQPPSGATPSSDPYARSITAVPQSMVLPGPMR
mmetsp:Transcript_1730/g.4193  ORF Transcript_1730/g.4193 Transcript_1730/m.4193 type:complete len:619 (+) Transcript_1730:110-1966(+)